MVCHGLGYLSKYFIKYFEILDPTVNYVIAPQAPSVYYQDKAFKYVGANWFTRENVAVAKSGILNYLDEIYKTEIASVKTKDHRLILLGYSQGVSVICRWMAARKIECDDLVLHSGGIPEELEALDFKYLNNDTSVHLVCGRQDQYLTAQRVTAQMTLANNLFEKRSNTHFFDGKHEFNQALIKTIIG